MPAGQAGRDITISARSLDILEAQIVQPYIPGDHEIPDSDIESFTSAQSHPISQSASQTPSPGIVQQLSIRTTPLRPAPELSRTNISEPETLCAVFRPPPALTPSPVRSPGWLERLDRYNEWTRPRPPAPPSAWDIFSEKVALKYPDRAMGYDRIEVLYASYIDKKNAWMTKHGKVIADWEIYRKMRVEEDIDNSKSITNQSRYNASWRWSCFMENHHYNRRRDNYESTDFEIFYKQLGPRGRAEPAWSALLHLPTRRRALNGTILETDVKWTDEEKHALIDFVMLQAQYQKEDDNCPGIEADERHLSGLVEYGVIPSLDQMIEQMPRRRRTGLFEELDRITMAKAAKRRTTEITSWDDNEKTQGPDKTDIETLNYTLDRWKAFVQTGAFPKESS